MGFVMNWVFKALNLSIYVFQKHLTRPIAVGIIRIDLILINTWQTKKRANIAVALLLWFFLAKDLLHIGVLFLGLRIIEKFVLDQGFLRVDLPF